MSRYVNIVGKVSFICSLIMISVLSLSPSESVLQVGHFDKAVHFLSYLYLSMSFWIGFKQARPIWLICACLILFGVLIEFLQSFVPGRLMSIMDAVANGLGVCFGYACFYYIKKRWIRGEK